MMSILVGFFLHLIIIFGMDCHEIFLKKRIMLWKT
jgi:hypothetical protein